MRSNDGTEYIDKKFMHLCERNGIHRHFFARKTPQLNGITEWMDMTLTEKVRCLQLNVGISKDFWATRLDMACYIVNKSPLTSLEGKFAEEVWTSNPIDLCNLRIFGCPTYVHISSKEWSKLDPKSK